MLTVLYCKWTFFSSDELRSLVRVLVQFNYDSKAKEIQHTYDSFLTEIDKSIQDIWLEESEDTGFKPVILLFSNKFINLAQNMIGQNVKCMGKYILYI